MSETITNLKSLLFFLNTEEDLVEFEITPTNIKATPVLFFPQHENYHVYHWHSFAQKANQCQMEQIPLGPSYPADSDAQKKKLALFCRECGLRFVIPDRILSPDELSKYLTARGAKIISRLYL